MYRSGVTMFGLERNWRFGVRGFCQVFRIV